MKHFRGGQSRPGGESEMSGKNDKVFKFFPGKSMSSYYDLIHQCRKYLWKKEPRIFEYPENWNSQKIRHMNRDLLELLPSKNIGVVYTISLRNSEKGSWRKKYVGSSKNLRERIEQHLISCSKNTVSCLKKVKKAVYDTQEIGISWVRIKPSFLRVGVEQIIIGLEKTKYRHALPWNKTPGKRSKKGSTSGSSD